MKRLDGKDVFNAMRLVKAAGLKNEFKAMASQINSGKKIATSNEAGIEFILNVIEGLADVGAEDKFWAFCARPFEMTADEVAELPIFDLMEKFKELAKMEDKEQWDSFFRSVAGLMK